MQWRRMRLFRPADPIVNPAFPLRKYVGMQCYKSYCKITVTSVDTLCKVKGINPYKFEK